MKRNVKISFKNGKKWVGFGGNVKNMVGSDTLIVLVHVIPVGDVSEVEIWVTSRLGHSDDLGTGFTYYLVLWRPVYTVSLTPATFDENYFVVDYNARMVTRGFPKMVHGGFALRGN